MGAMHQGHRVGGRYRLTAPLGRGAMGQVFRAEDERLRRQVAVKVVDLTQTTDRSIAQRFRREAIATAQLNHPSIVTIFDAGSDDRTAWLVMELLRGQDLAAMIRQDGAIGEERAVAIARKLADALVATHAIGVVHRDIKPANVMVDGDAVKLLDFGIALVQLDAEAHLTAAATTLGTAAYMSPEQAQGLRATAASDVYALGGVLVAMLTGRPPYPGDNPVQVAQRHVHEAPVSVRSRRPEVSPALAQLAQEPRGARTAVLPAAAVAAPASTAALPAPTTVLPAPTTVLPPATAVRPPAPDDGFRRAGLWLGVVIAAIVIFMVAWAAGSQVLRGLQGTPAAAPTASAPAPTTRPSLPVTLPTLPTGEQVALQAALTGVDAALAALPDTKASQALDKAWAAARADIEAGDSPAKAVESMRKEIARQRDKGDLNPLEAGALDLALSAVRAAI